MKRILILLSLLVLMSGCIAQDNHNKVNVAVSFYPLEYFAKEIGQEHVNVFNVLSNGMSAHDYEPSIQDRVKIEEADIFIHNGFHLEHWVDKTIEAINLDSITVINSSKGIEPLYHDDHPDPHIWLDPKTAMVQVDNILEALLQVDPKNESDYIRNYNDLVNRMNNLNEAYESYLSSTVDGSIVIEHEIFSYLSSRFDFNQYSISGYLPETEPSFQQLDRIIHKIEDDNIPSLLLSRYSSLKVAEVLEKETGINVVLIDPLEIRPTDKDYIEVMNDNLNALKEVLSNEANTKD